MANAPPSKEIELLLEEIINLLPAGPDIQYSFHNNHIVLYSLTFPTDMYDILYGEYAKTKVEGLQKHYATPYADAFINIMEERPKDACVVYKRHNDDKDRIIWSFLYSLIIKDIVLIVEKSPFDLNERIVRLLAPFELLCRESERQEEHFPLNKKTLINYFPGSQKYKDIDDSPFYGRVCTTRAQALKLEEDYLFNRSAPFHMSELYDFQRGDYRELGWKLVKMDFFTPALRSQLLSCVINSVFVKSSKMERFTVHDLLHKEYISSYFVLHDGPLSDPNSKSLRMLLKTWTKGKWTLPMPLHTVRDYFGETVAFYFAFIEYYTEWLRYSAVIGVGALIYGIISAVTDNRLTSLFDNEGSVVFSLVLVTWSLLFLKFWKRRVNFLCFAWDLDNFDENTVVRPQWVGTHERISDVTGEIEEYEPFWRQNLRTTISLMIMALIVMFLVGLFVATVYFQFLLSKTSFSSYGSVVASSAISLAQILLLGPLGSTIAIQLTNFENFQAQSIYLEKLMYKEFILSFTNGFGMLFYAAVIKPILSAAASDLVNPNLTILGFKPELCVSAVEGESSNCMVNLTISVVIVFAAKQFLIQAYEVIAPFIITRIDRRRKARILTTVVPEVYKDMTLKPVTYIDLYSEYDTKMMQLGYVVMFSASFTLAPLLAWANNVIEMRSDCFKYLAYYKRPFAEQAKGIGTWERIIKSMIRFGIFSNAVILSFSSQGMNRLVFKYIGLAWKYQIIFQVAFIIVYEHVASLIDFAIDTLIHDVPAKVRLARDGESYITKRRL